MGDDSAYVIASVHEGTITKINIDKACPGEVGATQKNAAQVAR